MVFVNKKMQMKCLIKALLQAKGESAQDKIYDELRLISPDPEWSDYIFHSSEFYDENEELDIDKLIEKVFSYKPIQL